MNKMKSQDRLPEDSAESKAPGFVVERRFFVRAAPIVIAALALGLPSAESRESRTPGGHQ